MRWEVNWIARRSTNSSNKRCPPPSKIGTKVVMISSTPPRVERLAGEIASVEVHVASPCGILGLGDQLLNAPGHRARVAWTGPSRSSRPEGLAVSPCRSLVKPPGFLLQPSCSALVRRKT